MELYVYSVRWYLDLGANSRMVTASGVIAADSMSDAVHRITTELYEGVEWVKIYAVEGGDSGYADINDINAVVLEHGLTSDE